MAVALLAIVGLRIRDLLRLAIQFSALQFRNGVQQFGPMPDKVDAEMPQIVACEAREEAAIDRVISEIWRVLLQAQAAQPHANVHLNLRHGGEHEPRQAVSA
jgi:hypothetical protein